jgi:aryl-alcohol dehydrogenase-like predicted oxidoreductase
VYQLHTPDPAVSFEASMETLAQLREHCKIRHVTLSNVTREHIERASKIVPIVSVQNRYSFADREPLAAFLLYRQCLNNALKPRRIWLSADHDEYAVGSL